MREVFKWRYRVDDKVRLRYAEKRGRAWIGRHLQEGIVRIVPGPGRGPRNYGVELGGELVVVPGGNIRGLYA
jgi:hypothetical protein